MSPHQAVAPNQVASHLPQRRVGSRYNSQAATTACEIAGMRDKLYKFSYSFARNHSEADDIVQDTMARALKSAHQYEPGTNLQAWLFTIAKNVFYTKWRRSIREPKWEIHDENKELSIDAPQEWSIKIDSLANALNKIPPDQRIALLLVSVSGMSYEAAAVTCDCAIGTIKSRVSRARMSLLCQLECTDQEEFLKIDRYTRL